MNGTSRKASDGNSIQTGPSGRSRLTGQWVWLTVILGIALAVLFIKSFQPNQILFVNDTTLGQMKAPANGLPAAFGGSWHPAIWLGIAGPATSPTLSALLQMIFPPEILLKLYAPFSMFFLGFCAWVFFRQLRFSPGVCLLGGLAAGLNMHFFSIACWGLGQWNIAAGMDFLALAALSSKSIKQLWVRAVLAGLAVGLNLMEGFDVGAIMSLFVGAFVLWQIFTEERLEARKVAAAFGTELLVIFFAAFIAAHSIKTLVGTQVEGVVGTSQDVETKEQRWFPATQWSLPKLETLRLFSPGLFGYRMLARINVPDTSGAYWGTVGRDIKITDLQGDDPVKREAAIKALNPNPDLRAQLESDDLQTRTSAISRLLNRFSSAARYSGSGEYAGLMVSALAFFGLANSWRGRKSPYSRGERRAIWFWGVVAVFSLMASWGRYAFFYRILYQLPYISTIRNPIKFMHPFHIAWLILGAYGMEAISRRCFQSGPQKSESAPTGSWTFEKKWIAGSMAIIALSCVALFVYNAWKPHVVEYLIQQGFTPERAIPIANFSVIEAGWFVGLLLVTAAAIAVIIRQRWRPSQAVMVWGILGTIIVVDQARADTPWIHYFDYKLEYSQNSVIDFLQDKPYEHRVTGRLAPKGLGSSISSTLGKLYDYWQQNEFPYHGIQAVDFSQFPRMPTLDANYIKKFALHGTDVAHCDLWPSERLWQLTNTRFLLYAGTIEQYLAKYADTNHGLHIKTFLSVGAKPGVTFLEDAGDLTAEPDAKGSYAIFEITNSLPRAKLYSHWQMPSNDDAALDLLASREFNPEQSVLIATNTPLSQMPGDPNADPGTVEIADYRPKYVKLQADAKSPAVLLLNDRIDPMWKVSVDNKPGKILRCNYLMRGVFLTPGRHTIEFRYRPPLTALYVSLCAWGVGLLTAGYLVYSSRAAAPVPAPAAPTSPPPSPAPAPSETTAQASQPQIPNRSKQKRKKKPA